MDNLMRMDGWDVIVHIRPRSKRSTNQSDRRVTRDPQRIKRPLQASKGKFPQQIGEDDPFSVSNRADQPTMKHKMNG